MNLSDNTKKVISTICVFLFLIGGGVYSNNHFQPYLPKEMFRSMIISDLLKLIAFFVLLSVFEPLAVKYKSKKFYLMIVINIIILIYFCYSSLKILF